MSSDRVAPDAEVTAPLQETAPKGPGSASPSAERLTAVQNLRRVFSRSGAGAVLAAVIVFAYFSIFAPHFMTTQVWSNIGALSAELGIVAIGVTVLMIAGEFDLSVGSVFGLVSGIAVLLMNAGLAPWLAIVACLALAAAIGATNGLLVTGLGIHSLVITLGGLMFYRAVLLALTSGFPIPIEGSTEFFDVFTARPGGLTVAWHWFIGLVVLAQVLVVTTREGNWQFAAGGNPLSAKELGVPVKRVKIRAFALTAVLAGFAGVVQLARFSSVDALRGDGLELEAVLAAVVGGTSLSGGVGSVIGTAMGVVMIAMMKQGLILMGVPGYYFRGAIGLLLIGAAAVNVYSTRRAAS